MAASKGRAEQDPVAIVRAICLALPEATEVEQWNVPTFRIRNKIFTIVASDTEPLGIWCKSDHAIRDALVEADPERYFKPPYLAKAGWIGIRLDSSLPSDELADFIIESYCLIAPKRLAAQVAAR